MSQVEVPLLTLVPRPIGHATGTAFLLGAGTQADLALFRSRQASLFLLGRSGA